jgi:hypothetical protein
VVVRRESVELSLQDVDFTSGMAKAAASTALLNRELHNLDGSSVKADRSTTALGDGGIKKTGDSARRSASDLNQYTGRLNLLATAATTLGPALLPIGATALPAVTALAGGLGALVGGVGTAVLAFHGLGGALKALDAYQLEPTDANLQKLQATLGKLSPAAQDLVMRLDELEPVLTRLQHAAQNGLFPGVNQGLDEILTLLPEVQTIVGRMANELGNLAADAGQSLAGDSDWQAFFQFIETDAVPTMDAFARATGNFVAGAASILVAFRPLSDGFTAGLLDMSRGFREWAAGLSESDGFRQFVDFINENGPAVRDFFEATAQAMVALAQAAAPWGAVVLPILTDAAKVFATVADSPIGPIIYDAAAAFLVFNRASALLGTNLPRISTGIAGTRTSLSGLKADLGTIATTWATAGAASERESLRMAAAQERVSAVTAKIGAAAKAAAGVGGMVLLANSAGQANKAIGALESGLGGAAIGFSVGGPWGAAVGGAAGLVLNLASAHKSASGAVADLTSTFDVQTGAITENTRAMVAHDLQTKGLLDASEQLGVSSSLVTDAVLGNANAQAQLNAALAGYNVDHSVTSADDLAKSFSDQEVATILADRAATKLRDTLPGLTDAFGGQSADAKQLARALSTDYAGGAQIATRSTVALAKAQEEARKNARQSAQAFTAFGSSLSDTKVSLGRWIRSMAEQAKALRDFTSNARTAARRGLREGLIAELEKAGPAGALRMKQLANASNTEIGRANRAWASGRRAIQAYVALKVPPKKVTVDSSQASAALDHINDRLNAINGRHATAYVTIQQSLNSKRAGIPKAEGGRLPGDGMPYGDRIPLLAAPTEYIVSNRNGQVDRNLGLLEAINSNRFADGGLVGFADGGRPGPSGQLTGLGSWLSISEAGTRISNLTAAQIRHLGKQVDDLSKKNLGRFGKALDKAADATQKRLDAEVQASDSVKGSIRSNLTGDLFGSGGSGSAFSQKFAPGSIGAVNATLKQQIADARATTALEKQLRARGVSGAALQELIEKGGVTALRSFASSSNADLRSYQSLYGQRSAAVGTAANTGASVLGMTAEIRRLTAVAEAISATQKAEAREAKRRHGDNKTDRKKNAKHTGEAAAHGVNKSAGSARGKRR